MSGRSECRIEREGGLKDSRRYVPILSPEVLEVFVEKDGMSRIRTVLGKPQAAIPHAFSSRFGRQPTYSLCRTLHAPECQSSQSGCRYVKPSNARYDDSS